MEIKELGEPEIYELGVQIDRILHFISFKIFTSIFHTMFEIINGTYDKK